MQFRKCFQGKMIKYLIFKNKKHFSNNEALLHLIKMNVGIGIMAMPTAFYNAGLLVGLVAMAFMASVTIHCMHLLVSDTHLNCHSTAAVCLLGQIWSNNDPKY